MLLCSLHNYKEQRKNDEMTSRKKGKQQSWRKRCQSGENPWKMGIKMRLVNDSENPEKRM